MEPLQPARRANGEHTRFHTAHMAANLRRIFYTFVWIIALVSSSRTRIYPPNEAPPKFTKIPTDQIGVSGGVASFVCQATGNPKPTVYWNKKGKKVNSQRIETIEFDEGAGAVLRIQPLRAPRDENIYECVARNSEGEVSVTAKLAIIREDL
ncbi:receptor-type tyrosine-protein phosphatase S-like isoform X3 [Lates japonicus]|uniref:Receptor-type tyrosine-protein phosphatase S-like isoform X3 n=1 Tax=Lates japonicus TaxID=270547 RepID=A0AAD3MS32_LATJO|nr:receptor-type tyrosine-protein phosphatase S-like isoform X3 [Lates japonicus]